MFEENRITYFAETDYRNKRTKFGIKAKDRAKHMYIIGKTGVGKSTLMENLAIQDIQNDEGIIFIDPHGSSAVKLLEYVPKHRIDDVIYFAPHDTDFPIAFNPLEQVPKEKRSAVAGGIMSTLKKIWPDSFSSRMEYILMYTLLSLLEVPRSTFLGVNRMMGDKVYRKYILDRVEDGLIRNFWYNEFDRYTTTYVSEATAPIQNKVGQFIASPMLRNIIGQEVSTLDFRSAMDQKKIVIMNLAKGIIGPENVRLLGGMLITKIQIAAMSRANLDEEALKRIPPTYLYVDEFQNFANESFAEILSESRKYKLCLTVANQYIDQMTEEVRNAVIGNVGTFISFRVGSTDAIIMEREFAPQFTQEDMVNLGFAQIYLKLMIDGMASRPFSATTLPPIPKPEKSYMHEAIGYSRKHYSRPKAEVEAEIKKWNNKDYHLENVKFAEEQSKKKKGSTTGLGLPSGPISGVLLNEMNTYETQLLRDSEKLKQSGLKKQEKIESAIPRPTSLMSQKTSFSNLGQDNFPTMKLTKEELDSIMEELITEINLSTTPKPVVKSGEILGEKELQVVRPMSVSVEETSTPRKLEFSTKPIKNIVERKKRRQVLQKIQKDFEEENKQKESRQRIKDIKFTKVKKPKDEGVPEDVLRALLEV